MINESTFDKSKALVVAVIAIAISLFHMLNVAGIIVISTMPIRVIHLMAMMLIVFLTKGTKKKGAVSIIDNLIRVIGFLLSAFCSIYLLVRYNDIANSGGQTMAADIIIGTIMMIVVLEATRRSVGLVLAIISAIFLVYPFIGPYLPGMLQTRNYSLTRVMTLLFTTSDGIYGTPISVSANYIILFCIYGAFLSHFGAGEFLFRLSSCFTRRFVAASAKTSIIFCALLGMISGSAAGVVAVAGALTIPMMIREGYTKEEAGAVSAVAATGGQIMPPVMGAAAFILASIIGVPYAQVMKAAILPAILYFFSIFVVVHFTAKKRNMKKNEELMNISIKDVLKDWPLGLPIVALIVMMVIGYSPFKAAFWSILALLIIYIPYKYHKDRKFEWKNFGIMILKSLESGAKDTVSIAVACAAAGIISGILSLTGLSVKLASLIVTISHGHLIIALILTMIISLILGMGLPTTAAYLVLATVIAPALVQMGASMLSAHLFVFYFGCISTITPPVALASYVAAGIAKANLNSVGDKAFWYGIVSFLLPYMFVYGPGLLLEGSIGSIIQVTIFSIIGTLSIGLAIVGYAKCNLNIILRILLILAGIMMIYEEIISSIVGTIIFIAIYAWSAFKAKSKEVIPNA